MIERRRVIADWRVRCGRSAFTMPAGSEIAITRRDEAANKVLVGFGGRDTDWFYRPTVEAATSPVTGDEAA